MPDGFVVAIASGKGGTGKTTVAANLARTACDSGRHVQYLDCDVEEPNGHIFLRPQITASRQVTIDVPQVDTERCTACGECGKICQYSAIVCLKENVLTFEQLCHACGGCFRVCPDDAIRPKPLAIGTVAWGKAGEIDFVSGKLNIGHVRTPTLIKEVKKHIRSKRRISFCW
jgi:MinD superfamily P-loop ATPase